MAITWAQAERAFSRYLLANCKSSNRTAISYCYNTRFFWSCLLDKGIDPIHATEDQVADWFVARRAEVSPNKVYMDLMSVRAFYRCCIRRKWREDNPACEVQAKKQETAPEAPYSPHEVTRIRAALTYERDRLILDVFRETGMRIAEIVEQMLIEDVDWSEACIRVVTKGGDQKTVWLPRDLANRLRLHIGGRLTGPIWRTKFGGALKAKSFRANLSAAAARCGITNVHPHRFRSTFAIEMLRLSGGDLQAVQELMGHASIVTTQRYTRWDKQERARALIQRRHELREIETVAIG